MTFKVAIVGGGIAGLAVAHALERSMRERGERFIHVTVYEAREDEADIQRYPIHLDPDGREALRCILGPETYQQLVERASQGTEHGGISLFTPRLSRLLQMRQHEGEQPQFVHRWVLKDILSQGVNVVCGRRVSRADDANGRVRITFDDGSIEDADLVVGADGVGSALRSQLYPSHRSFERLPYIDIQMKLVTPPLKLPALMDKRGINAILGTQDYSILLVPFHREPLPDLPSAQHASAARDATAQEMLKAINGPRPQFLFAILTLKCLHDWRNWTSHNWQIRVIELLTADKADPTIIEAFRNDSIPGTVGSPWQVVSHDPANPVPYDGGRVVLIDDAAHVIPPQAGAGASTALMDAQKLSRTILLGLNDRQALQPMLLAFHREMTKRAGRHAKDARRRLYLSNQSGLSIVPQRAILRLLNVAWRISDKLSRPFSITTRRKGRKHSDGPELEGGLVDPVPGLNDSSETLVIGALENNPK